MRRQRHLSLMVGARLPGTTVPWSAAGAASGGLLDAGGRSGNGLRGPAPGRGAAGRVSARGGVRRLSRLVSPGGGVRSAAGGGARHRLGIGTGAVSAGTGWEPAAGVAGAAWRGGVSVPGACRSGAVSAGGAVAVPLQRASALTGGRVIGGTGTARARGPASRQPEAARLNDFVVLRQLGRRRPAGPPARGAAHSRPPPAAARPRPAPRGARIRRSPYEGSPGPPCLPPRPSSVRACSLPRLRRLLRGTGRPRGERRRRRRVGGVPGVLDALVADAASHGRRGDDRYGLDRHASGEEPARGARRAAGRGTAADRGGHAAGADRRQPPRRRRRSAPP